MVRAYDVLVVGGGVVGCAVARELSRFSLRVAVLERELDVGLGTSCRNSGVLHAGSTTFRGRSAGSWMSGATP